MPDIFLKKEENQPISMTASMFGTLMCQVFPKRLWSNQPVGRTRWDLICLNLGILHILVVFIKNGVVPGLMEQLDCSPRDPTPFKCLIVALSLISKSILSSSLHCCCPSVVPCLHHSVVTRFKTCSVLLPALLWPRWFPGVCFHWCVYCVILGGGRAGFRVSCGCSVLC